MKQKKNLPLIVGCVLLFAIFVIIVFPEWFTSRSPYTIQTLRYSHINGELNIEAAPFSPSDNFFLGSDELGRDVWSFIIYGTRLTVLLGFLVAFGRFLVALPLALHAGFGHKGTDGFIRQFNILFSAIPALLISIIILKLDYFKGLDKERSILAFVIVLSGIGWPRMARLLQNRIEWIKKQSFVKGAVAIGKHPFKIAIENVIPHLVPEMTVLFFMEIARALSMIMQLGIFGVFIGNLRIIKDADFGQTTFYDISFEPEWASMLGSSKNFITAAPWVILFPAIAFFITVLALNLFGEGLREVMQQKDSKTIPIIRKILTLDYEGILKLWSRQAKRRIIIAVIALLVFFASVKASEFGRYQFDYANQSEIPFEQVLVGTEEAYDTAAIIVEKMKMLGVQPLEDENYIYKYDIYSPYFIQKRELKLNDTIINHENYAFVKAPSESISSKIYNATEMDLYSINDYSVFEDRLVMIDKSYYNIMMINHFVEEARKYTTVPGVILVAEEGESMDYPIAVESADVWQVLVDKKVADMMLENKELTVSLSAEHKLLEKSGQNIIGLYEGSDVDMNDEVIIIGLSYNYLRGSDPEILQFNLELMERLCTQENNRRSIMFMFMDGTISESHHGIYAIEEDFPYVVEKSQVIIDLTGIDSLDFESIEFSAIQAPITRQFAWNVGYKFDTLLGESDIMVKEADAYDNGGEFMFSKNYSDNVMFWEIGIANIIINTEHGNRSTLNELGSLILEVISDNNF